MYKDRIILLDIIKDEFTRIGKHPPLFDIILNHAGVEEIIFPTDNEEQFNEFLELNSDFGEGESACMAYAKFNDNIIASSNLRDIKNYCIKNKITYITTMDIIEEAFNKKIMDLADCDLFISKVINNKSKLPFDSITKYLQSKK